MAFDESKYRAAAKAAGYSDDEINAELNTKAVAESAPAGASMPPAPTETFSDAQAKAKADYDARVHKALTASVTVGDHTYEIPSFFTSPAGIITAAGAGIGLASTLMGAAKVAPKTYNAIKDRWISKAPAIDRNVDIPFEGPTATLDAKTTTPTPIASNAPTPTPVSEWDDLIARSEKNKADKAAYAAAKAGVPVVEAPVVGATPSGAPVAPVPISAPVTPDATSIAQPTLKEVVSTGGDVGQALKTDVAGMVDQAALAPVAPPEELRTGTGKPAFAGQGPEPTMGKKGPQFKKEYPSLESVPKGYAFVPGAQYMDPLRNDLGQAAYTQAFTGRELPQTYEEAISTGKEINRSLGRATREEAKAAGLPPAETTEGIAKKTTENKKLVKIIGKAGLAGALVSLADLALAKTPEEKTNAGLGLLGAILPPGMDINAAGAPGVQQSQVSNAALLGSPYAQTEWAKTQRLRERAGAGRGIVPPSAYQR